MLYVHEKWELKSAIEEIEGQTLKSAILSPLTLKLPISASEKDRGSDFIGLNRHQVLHGEVVDYNTKINSLQAISCINYMSQVLEWIRKSGTEFDTGTVEV